MSFLQIKYVANYRVNIKTGNNIVFIGGSNTAGLGGFGGPYRLDAGHQVFQVPQWEKDAVPESVS